MNNPEQNFQAYRAIIAELNKLKALDQVVTLEWVAAVTCTRMGQEEDALRLADGINKHVKELIEELFVARRAS